MPVKDRPCITNCIVSTVFSPFLQKKNLSWRKIILRLSEYHIIRSIRWSFESSWFFRALIFINTANIFVIKLHISLAYYIHGPLLLNFWGFGQRKFQLRPQTKIVAWFLSSSLRQVPQQEKVYHHLKAWWNLSKTAWP